MHGLPGEKKDIVVYILTKSQCNGELMFWLFAAFTVMTFSVLDLVLWCYFQDGDLSATRATLPLIETH